MSHFHHHNQSRDDLKISTEWIKLKKEIGSITERHPLTLTIDTIFNLADDAKVISDSERA